MPRIEGVDLPSNKRVEIGLTYIYGIGRSTAQTMLTNLGIDFNTRVKDLTEAELVNLRKEIDEFPVEGELRREVRANIKRLIDIGSYRGLRHRRGLPVRGQNTKTNARTRKGPKKTVGVRRVKEES